MIRRFDLDRGDLGRGEGITVGEIPLVFRIVADAFKYLPDDNWVYGFEISNGSETNINQTLKNYARKNDIMLYEVDGRVLFDLRNYDNEPLHRSIFYIIKVKQ